ncbi:MAG TPA: pyridoxine 5'-phosphate synthase [Bacteroidales bacterium]|nr:pyridoxine 5'-phosphate synthase [Bacteroidales bacterium]
MSRLSVNINKIATIRNARGGNIPDVLQAAINSERFGADGVTVHPRPDERHIRYSDVRAIRPVITTEFNIEGYPNEQFLKLIEEIKPHQVTLVPDPPDALTSNAGWETKSHLDFLRPVIRRIKEAGCRTSIFVDTKIENIQYAVDTGTDRIELYTEPYATDYHENREAAIEDFVKAAEKARELNLGINAGHDLNLDNLAWFKMNIPWLDEVSIGHALISDALYYGLENTIQMYKRELLKR